MNVRTEIAYGMFTDGCTALCWALKDGNTFLAQNWDWRNEQAENLIHLIIEQPEKPTIDMITEAGIIGKIGQNSSGIGVCLNAIRARGVDFNKLPCHLALRTCLESRSAPAAIEELQKSGVASACHILVADADVGGTGLECSHLDIKSVMPSDRGVVTHTNHFLKEHADVNEVCDLPDTIARLRRINYLVGGCKDNPSMDDIANMLKDEDNYPTSINRAPTKDSTVETLFSIVMNLTKKESRVKFGRPS
ncbi:MAG: hypothetical protein MMC33_004415 [Icmadophila ericetorum]|nr:hypothetical protein [Icmadophila ericetorum]